MFTVYFIGSAMHTLAQPVGNYPTASAALAAPPAGYHLDDSQGLVLAGPGGMVTHVTDETGVWFALASPQPLSDFAPVA